MTSSLPSLVLASHLRTSSGACTTRNAAAAAAGAGRCRQLVSLFHQPSTK